MPHCRIHDIEIDYDEFGPADGEPVLLVMGLGSQKHLWDEEFCDMLVARGHRVVRFDNRDVGGSTILDHHPAPKVLDVAARMARGEEPAVPYLLSDMARDAAGLLDALALETAHVVGVSMGGMIAQTLALEHPERVRSLTSIMSSTGRPDLPPARPAAAERLLRVAPAEREAYADHSVETSRVIGSPGFPFDEERVRRRALRSWDRRYAPAGAARQLAAIVASGSRHEALRGLGTPTLVIHGADDPLVPLEAGLDTHASVPDSELWVIEGMGHDIPAPLFADIADRITKHAERG